MENAPRTLGIGLWADSRFAQLPLHVLDEQLGQPRGAGGHPAFVFQPQHDQREHQRDHVVATLDAVGDAAHAIPVGIAGFGNGALPQGAPLFARVGAKGKDVAEKAG